MAVTVIDKLEIQNNPTLAIATASRIEVDISAFAGNLSSADNTVQKALDTIDNLSLGGTYTDENAQDAVGTILVDSATIDFTYSDATPSITANIIDGSVTYAKIQNVSATDKLLGRSSIGAGSVEEITCTSFGRSMIDDADASAARTTLGLGTLATQSGTFSGTSSGTNTGDQTITLTGDVTGSGTGSFAATIASSSVTLAKMADVATSTVFYRKTTGTGAPEVQTLSTLKTDLGLTGTNSGDQTITLTGDVTGSGTGSFAATIANDAVTYAKIQNVSATDKLLGRSTAGAGDIEEITCTSYARSILDDADAATVRTTLGLGTLATQSGTFSGTSSGTNTGDQTITLTGDVTGSGTGSFAATIASGSVTLAKMANVATSTVFYRKTASTGAPEVQTLATLKTDLGLTGTNSGDQTITLTGDVTGSGTGSFAATIASGSVTLAKMANVATSTVFYRKTASTGVPEVQTLATLKTDLGLTGTNSGDQTITLTGDITGSGTGSFATTIANDAVTYAKIQNVSATDKILGRSSIGAGDIEEITCTAAGRALIDDADASAQRTTLGLGTLATQSGTFSGTSSGTNTGDQTITLTGDVTGSGTGSFAATIANDAVTYAKIQNVSATDKLLGRSSVGAGDVEEITCTSFGRSLIDDADATTARTTLGLGTLATQSGTFSGTSSGTNTGDQTITLTGDVTGSGTGSFAATIASSAVTLAKMADVSTSTVFYRKTVGTGAPEVQTLSTLKTDLGLTGTNSGDQTITLTGDVTGSGTGSFAATIASSAVTYAKIQNVSATDKLLGRSTAGAGVVEEITCTAAGRALIDDADASAQRTTLGLGTAATSNTTAFEASGAIATHAAITSSVHGISAFGATLVDDADASAARTTLGLGTLATQSGTFSGTSSGTNTGDQTITLTGDVTGSGTGSFAATIASSAVTYAKIQNVSATDKLLGRSTAGAGVVEEITCTSAGRALLDDADAATQRTTLGLGTLNTPQFLALGLGLAATSANLSLGGNISASSWFGSGIALNLVAATYTNTTSSGTVGSMAVSYIAQPTLESSNTLTITNAATLYISNSPAAGTNTTLTSSWSLWVDNGDARFDGFVGIGNLSAKPVSDLEVSSSSAIDGTDPTTVTIRSTRNSSAWTVDAHYGRLDFYSDDLSATGVRARIAAAAANTACSGTNLIFYTDAGGSLTECFRFNNNGYAQFGGSTSAAMLAVTSSSTAPTLLRIDAPASHANNAIDVVNNGTRFFTCTSSLTVNVGNQTTASAKLHVLATTEQLRIGYDASNYFSATVASTGGVTFDSVGAGASFTFNDSVKSTSSITSTGTAGVGYSTGAGGTVTQITNRTTGVTLNKICGAITLVSAAGSASWQSFTVTNSTVAATDCIVLSQKSGTDLYILSVTNVAAGSFKLSFATTGGTTTEQPVFNFSVIKAVTS